MSWSQGFLNGFSTVNNAIQGWEDRKERREQRDEDRAWQQKTWDYRVQRDEKNDAVNADNTTWNRGMEEKKLKETVNTNRATIAQGNSRLAIASQQLKMQQQANELAMYKAKRELEKEQWQPKIDYANRLASMGDYTGAAEVLNGVPDHLAGETGMALRDPKNGVSILNGIDRMNKILSGLDVNDSDFLRKLNTPEFMQAFAEAAPASFSASVGQKGVDGKVIKNVKPIMITPVPYTDGDSKGHPMPGKFAIKVLINNEDGSTRQAFITENRSALANDKVKVFSMDELQKLQQVKGNITNYLNTLIQKQQQGLSIAEQAKLYGQTINAASRMGQSPDEATQFADGVVAKFSNQGQGNGPLSQAANNQNDPLQQMARTNNNVSGLLNSREIQALIKTPEGKEAVYRVLRGAQNKGTLSKFTTQILAENVNKLLNTKQKGNSQRVQDYIQFKVAMDKKEAENRSGVPMN